VNLRFHGEIFFKIRASGTPFVGLFSLRHVPQGVHHVPYLQLECKLTLVVFGKDFLKNSALGGGGISFGGYWLGTTTSGRALANGMVMVGHARRAGGPCRGKDWES
jgi:hypothetical protein